MNGMTDSVARTTIERLDAPDGSVTADIVAVADLVNAVYEIAEAGMWQPGTTRTDPHEVAGFAAAGTVRVARIDGCIVGCIRVVAIDETTAEFGMLATDPAVRGAGIGKLLVSDAEKNCIASGFRTMQLEVVRPRERPHESKEFLDRWYTRLGYVADGISSLDDRHPELVVALAVPCETVTYRKPLR